MDFDKARDALISRTQLEERGLSSRRIAHAVQHGSLVRVHHGCYADRATWNSAYPEGRHLMRVIGVHSRSRGGDTVVAMVSAAVLWQLPLYSLNPKWVHLAGSGADGKVKKATGGVVRHLIEVPEADRTSIGGIPCTNLPRTVADLVRVTPAATALAIADAAFRLRAYDEKSREYDLDAAEEFRAEVSERLERHRRARHLRQGRRILELADGRAQLPGESVSRLQLLLLGFAAPRLQVPIPAPEGDFYYVDFGLDYYVDFGLDDVNAWGEFDGIGKYTDPAMLGDRKDAAEVLLAEKMREDWIRGTTNRRMPRWGSEHIGTAAALGERLASFHVFAP